LGKETWLLWGATVLWTLGFDTIYAMSDREDDRRIGVNSSALFFGKYASLAVGAFFTGTTFLLAKLGIVMELQLSYWVALCVAIIGWAWQYSRLSQKTIPHSVYADLFRQNVWIGFVLLTGMIVGTKG
jgi:4-hydroxybenzoate polyprenyltransferase